MSPGAEQERDAYESGGDPFVREQLDSIDGSLLAGMPDDERFSSGVPDGQRASSLDFIQMTGLTRAPVRQTPITPQVPEPGVPEDLNPTAPLSFYEKGVADVDDGGDSGMDGFADALLDAKLVPDSGDDTLRGEIRSPSIDAFKDIVAGLESGGADVADPAPSASVPEELELPAAEPAPEPSPSSDLLAMLNEVEEMARAADSDSLYEPPAPASTPEEPSEAIPIPEAVESDDSLTDDWDAMLDAVTTGSSTSSDHADSEVVRPPSGSGALAEAEQLLHALEQKQAPAAPSPVEASEPATPPAPSLLPTYSPTPQTSVDLDGDLAYDYSAAPSRRRSRRHSRAARRGKRFAMLLFSLALLAGGLSLLYVYVLAPMIVQAEDLRAKALRLETEGKFEESSRAYQELAGKLGSGPAGADAQFRAAYVLTLGEPRNGDEKQRRYRSALNRFETLLKENPAYRKNTRAVTIMGRLHYELDEFDKAIAILQETDPQEDPQAALTKWRYLARSYVKQGDYEPAESAYLQAANLPGGNYSADQDYYSLGEMFKKRAELSDSDADKARFLNEAAKYWNKAIQVPGIEPSQKIVLQERLEWLKHESGSTAAGVPEDSAPASMPLAEAPEATPEIPMDSGDGAFEEDPAAELKIILTAPAGPAAETAAPVGPAE